MTDRTRSTTASPVPRSAGAARTGRSPVARPLQSARALRHGVRDLPRHLAQQFTRQRIMNFLKTLALTVPLTLLLWVYAEREGAVPQTLTVPLTISTSAPDRIAWLQGSEDRLRADVLGPRARVSAVADRLSRGEHVTIAVDPSLTPGPQEILTQPALNRADMFANNGVAVESCQPPNIRVYIDEIVQRDLPVKLPQAIKQDNGQPVSFDGPPAFDPPTVRYRGPRRLLDNAGTNAFVIADLSGRPSLASPGAHTESNVPIRLSDAFTGPQVSSITLNPTSVNVSFTLRPSDITITQPAIPLTINAASSVLNSVVITNPESIPNVKLKGPPEILDQIQDQTWIPKARIDITSADVSSGVVHKKPIFDLPKGVVVDPDVANREIEVRLTPRTP